MPDQHSGDFNVIALCFTMTCSYDPPMMAVSFEKRNHSFDLMKSAEHFVLAVPGESLAQSAMVCGVTSGRTANKFEECKFTRQQLSYSSVPGIAEAIANIELRVENRMLTGDHLTVIGRVLGYHVNAERIQKNLLAVGPNQTGYKVLAHRGIHRIAVVEGEDEAFMAGFDIDRILG